MPESTNPHDKASDEKSLEAPVAFSLLDVYLDAFFGPDRGTLSLPPEFAALFKPRPPPAGDLPGLAPRSPPTPDQIAPLPGQVIDYVVRNSRSHQNLKLALTKFSLLDVGYRPLAASGWPWKVTHFWFRIAISTDQRQDASAFVYPWLQDFFYGLKEVLEAQQVERAGLSASATISILANCEPAFFAQIRKSWDDATQVQTIHPTAPPSLWNILPHEFQVGNFASTNHMAFSSNLHGFLAPLYSNPELERQVISITFQDASRPSYGRDGAALSAEAHDLFSPEPQFLSPNRASYYRPRSQELGLLLLLDQWLPEATREIQALAKEGDNAVEASEGPVPFRVLWSDSPIFATLQTLRRRTGAKNRGLSSLAGVAKPALAPLVKGQSIYTGVEVPAYLFPPSAFGRQGTKQEGLILGISERALLRIDEALESVRDLSSILTKEAEHLLSRQQALQNRTTTWLAAVAILLTIANIVLTIAQGTPSVPADRP